MYRKQTSVVKQVQHLDVNRQSTQKFCVDKVHKIKIKNVFTGSNSKSH